MSFFGKAKGNSAMLPNATPGASNMGGGTLYSGPASFGKYRPGAATATNQQGARAQSQALNDLTQMSQTGWTGTDQAQIQSAQRQAEAGASAQQAGALQQAAARGQAGGGMQFASALQAGQGAADRARDSANQIAMQGAQNRMGAGQAAFGAGGQLEGQAVARGAATDAFNQWASGREGMATQQSFENAHGLDKDRQDDENKKWAMLAGLAG